MNPGKLRLRVLGPGARAGRAEPVWADRMPDGLSLDGHQLECSISATGSDTFVLRLAGRSVPLAATRIDSGWRITLRGRAFDIETMDERAILIGRLAKRTGGSSGRAGMLRAPMPGLVSRLMTSPGRKVTEGDGLVVLEAMKMQNELRAPVSGHTTEVHVSTGDAVDRGDLLVTLGPPGSGSAAG